MPDYFARYLLHACPPLIIHDQGQDLAASLWKVLGFPEVFWNILKLVIFSDAQ